MKQKRKLSPAVIHRGDEDDDESMWDVEMQPEPEPRRGDPNHPFKRRRNEGTQNADAGERVVNRSRGGDGDATNGELDTSKPSAVFKPTKGRGWTLSVALPGSFIAKYVSFFQVFCHSLGFF